jgi:hypothetical protein
VYEYINRVLSGDESPSFTTAVFAVENAYYDGKLAVDEVIPEFNLMLQLTRLFATPDLITYKGRDESVVVNHAALFKAMTDSLTVGLDSIHTMVHLPYTYDDTDVLGQSDWSNMFVSKLLRTGKGNCHSLPYLYMMLSEQLDIPCYLAFAPNHIYVKLFNESIGWFNTELTSATFPVDAWIIASGYVNKDAVANGLYMDTLNTKRAIANCLVDLAQGYRRKFPTNSPEFVLKCCNTVLAHHPHNVNALLTKAEALKEYMQRASSDQNLYQEMEKTYAQLHRLGYRRMPAEMYRQWLQGARTYGTRRYR